MRKNGIPTASIRAFKSNSALSPCVIILAVDTTQDRRGGIPHSTKMSQRKLLENI